jgi:phage gpG-like protein
VKITGAIIGDKETLLTLGRKGDDVRAELRRAVERLAPTLAGIVKDKLSDDVLRVRTGRLRRSITYAVREEPGGVYGTVGTNVEYARFHELGFHGTQSVREHLRKVTQGFGKAANSKMVKVRAHERHVDYAGRPFLRPSLEQLQPEITAELEKAAGKALQR